MTRKPVKANNSNRVFYGWIVCGVCTLLIFITMGTASNGLAVFLPYIMREHGLSNAQTSSLVTLRCTFAFVSMLLVSQYYNRVGYRIGTGVAALCCCAAYVIYSCADTYFEFCIGASMAGISYGLGSMIPASILMNRWFVKHRALAIGIVASGSGIAVIVLPPVLTGIILRASLRTAFLITAAYVLAASITVFLLIREKPQDKGLEPLGQAEVFEQYRRQKDAERTQLNGTTPTPASTPTPDPTPASSPASSAAPAPAVLSRRGWLLMGTVCLIMGALSNPGFVHLSVLYTSEGFRPMTVALLISICGIVLTFSKVICGEAADLLGGLRMSLLFSGILLAGNALCCLAFTGIVPLAMTAVFLYGLGSPICTVGIPVWAGDLSSPEKYPTTVRNLQLIYAAGAMIFATMPGIIADHLGSYIPVYALFACLVVASVVCLVAAYAQSSARK